MSTEEKDTIIAEEKPKKRGRPRKTDVSTESNTEKEKTTNKKTTESSKKTEKTTSKKTTTTAKKKTSTTKRNIKEPKVFEELEPNNEEKKELVDDRTVFKIDEELKKKIKDSENNNIESNKIESEQKRIDLEKKFATQRVASIREELDRTNLKELEFERKKEAWKQEIFEKEQALIKKYESKMAAIEENNNTSDEEDSVEEDLQKRRKGRREEKTKKKHGILFKIFRFFFILGILGILVVAFLLYNPWWGGFRDWYITTAMTTMNHQWLATMLYPQKVIDEVMARNKVIEVDGITDNSLISTKKKEEKIEYANEFERAVLEKDPEHEDYKIIDIEGDGYNGYLAVVYDASKVHTMVTSKLNVIGEYVADMAVNEGAVLAINGGGFDDPNYSSNGGSPTGITICRGEILTDRNNGGSVGGLVGFDEDNVLTLGRISASQAEEMGIRDAVTTSCPLLIINGEASEVVGNGGWGEAARTVIGQRQDGIVLMLVLNGRNFATGIVGADMDDLIEIMERYGAYNAACLDGGTSSVIVENGEVLNDPIDGRGRHQTRLIPTAFGVFLNE